MFWSVAEPSMSRTAVGFLLEREKYDEELSDPEEEVLPIFFIFIPLTEWQIQRSG